MKYRYFSLAAGIMVFPGMALQSKAQEQDRPNILFILSDDHTSQTWGIYGGILERYVRNDNIRRLASEGVVLDNCFCTNSISTPSRAAMLTGRYSHTNGVYTLDDSLSTEIPTIAKVLQASGYNTALVRENTGIQHSRTVRIRGLEKKGISVRGFMAFQQIL